LSTSQVAPLLSDPEYLKAIATEEEINGVRSVFPLDTKSQEKSSVSQLGT
jgi:hypothetical protein